MCFDGVCVCSYLRPCPCNGVMMCKYLHVCMGPGGKRGSRGKMEKIEGGGH